MSDQELIELFIAGNTSAFNRLVSRWQKKIFHFAYRYTCSSEAAKDISQETFIRAYKNLVYLQDHDRFPGWLYRIAMNACLDHKKKRRRRHISLDELDQQAQQGHNLPPELWTAEKEHPDQNVQRYELQEIIQKALATLPEEQRIVVIMKQYQDLKFTEIADILQESVNTVKTRMYSGLANLRQNLNVDGLS
jgi:RNA polymerase sigma-70 factor, ECF subfamily